MKSKSNEWDLVDREHVLSSDASECLYGLGLFVLKSGKK